MTTSNDPRIRVRRIYDDPESSDGSRVLVDRVWPRGVSKEHAHLDEWLKDVAPSTDLRQWYGHDPDKYDEFARRYREELKDNTRAEALDQLKNIAAKGTLTLLTASKRDDISQAAVLKKTLDSGRHG
ncbi:MULTISPECIES: DUF488 domain-containing protein [unclassified Brevibacterium]|uniref:DUF488 domain-containing protein n=1 Tax=unclassified Brevibacterium TaxID=2614124 RepID=UPI001091A41C|nr:DUF488 family protein [Brevibacterium sp. S22]TGD32713.1 DUF488 family protein [Brevibacterium sp. S22]